jgi:hypothetical protein
MLRLAACLSVLAWPVAAEGVASARYEEPTSRYAHGILGDAVEWGALIMEAASGQVFRVRLPETRVFEDTEPRLVDVDGDGDSEVIAVETDVTLGARLSVYDTEGLVAANDFIGRTNRWLAPVGLGAADLDGDGEVEFAYVDRPHLAKTLLILRRDGKTLRVVASLEGVTNHRIGETDIAGGIRECGQGPEMIVATADWSDVLAVKFDGASFATQVLAPHEGRETFEQAMACRI